VLAIKYRQDFSLKFLEIERIPWIEYRITIRRDGTLPSFVCRYNPLSLNAEWIHIGLQCPREECW
jgi:hypothetical protein